MSITVSGILKDPLGNPLEATIRVTAENSKIAVKGAHGSINTSSNGSYNFELEQGLHLVQILQDDEYTEGTVVLVDSGTPSSIDLGTLLELYQGQV